MIWTFYSFKGGAGRSMALANVAEYLYRQDLRVVMVDWDLEAPGLESFFFRAPDELSPIRSQLGLIDVLLAYKRQFPLLSIPAGGTSAGEVAQMLRQELAPLSGVLYPVHETEAAAGPSDEAGLWLLTAGWRGGERFPDYVEAVQSFDWSEFYRDFHGEAFFEWLRGQLLDELAADVVLIDSRTGATEMGGVCTRQLADVVVAFCVPNLQNLFDTFTMTESFQKQEVIEARGRPLQVLVIPTRIENSEIDSRNRFRKEFRGLMDRFTPPALKRVDTGFWDLKLPYIPKYAYLENLAIGASDSAEELETAYRTLTMNLALLAPEGSRLRTASAPLLISAAGKSSDTGALPPVWNVPHSRNPDFVGRAHELAQLRELLLTGATVPAAVAVTGLGGSGKTQLAIEYAYRFRSDYDVVCWIRGADPMTRAADVAGLASALSLPEAGGDDSAAIEAVRKWLRQNARWLLVFDAVQSPEEVRPYLPQGGFGHVLITSRNPSWRRTAEVVALDTLSPEEAAAFLLNRTGQSDLHAASELAEALGWLPLALEQAAAYMEETGTSLAAYLQLFRQYQARILREGEVLGYQRTVATTWEVSLNRIEEVSPEAVDLLRLCAFLAPDDIPHQLIVDGAEALPSELASRVADPLGLNAVVAVLRAHSLMRTDGESLSVHRLVQAVTRDRLDRSAAELWATAAVGVVGRSFPPDARDPRRWPVAERLVGHALAATEHTQRLGRGLVLASASSLLNAVGVYLHACGRFAEARSALERAHVLASRVQRTRHPNMVRTATNLGLLQLRMGAANEALATTRNTLELSGSTVDRFEIVPLLTVFGSAQLAMGYREEAKTTLEKAFDEARKSVGDKHPATLAVQGALAAAVAATGDLATAQALQEQVLASRRALLGPDHPETLDAMASLAATQVATGDLATAQPLQEQVLASRRALLGPDHPETLDAMIALAETLRALGDPDRAALLEDEAVTWRREPPAARVPPPLPNTAAEETRPG